MISTPKTKIVTLGQIVATPGALDAFEQSKQSPMEFLSRHRQGDWGDVCPEDWDSNDQDFQDGNRLLSTYKTSDGTKIWIITEWNRSVTTLLLPEEY